MKYFLNYFVICSEIKNLYRPVVVKNILQNKISPTISELFVVKLYLEWVYYNKCE